MFYVYMQSSWMNKKWIVAPILAYENRILLEVQSASVLSLKDDFFFLFEDLDIQILGEILLICQSSSIFFHLKDSRSMS